MAAFFAGLGRACPGNSASFHGAEQAADLAPDAVVPDAVVPDAVVPDAVVGPGPDTGALLVYVTQGRGVTLDHATAFIDRVQRDQPTAQALLSDMLPTLGGPFDLIWSAGAVSLPGIRATLTAWRAPLAPGGHTAFSHLCGRQDTPSTPAQAVWSAKADVANALGAVVHIQDAAFCVLAQSWLTDTASDASHTPIEARMMTCASQNIADDVRTERTLWHQNKADCGCLVLVVEPA